MSARFAIAAAETVAAAARHRGAILGEQDPVARVVDLGTVIDVLRGKLEFESGEEGREQAVLEHLLRRATADTASAACCGGSTSARWWRPSRAVAAVTTGERVSAKDVLGRAARAARGGQDRGATRRANPTGERGRGSRTGAGGAVPGEADRQGIRRGAKPSMADTLFLETTRSGRYSRVHRRA